MRIIYREEASQELREAAVHYDEQRLGLGDDFIDLIAKAVATAASDPNRFPVVCDNIRRARVQRFPYCVCYRVDTDTLEVLAIKHHSREPDYWKGRR